MKTCSALTYYVDNGSYPRLPGSKSGLHKERLSIKNSQKLLLSNILDTRQGKVLEPSVFFYLLAKQTLHQCSGPPCKYVEAKCFHKKLEVCSVVTMRRTGLTKVVYSCWGTTVIAKWSLFRAFASRGDQNQPDSSSISQSIVPLGFARVTKAPQASFLEYFATSVRVVEASLLGGRYRCDGILQGAWEKVFWSCPLNT